MIATSQPSTSFPTRPSRQVVKAAQTAVSSQHALVNLIRLVKSLEGMDPELSEEVRAANGMTSIFLRRDWEV